MSADTALSSPARLFDVTGRGAVVTGAASGLGEAIARVLARNGARVTLVDRDSEALEAVCEDLAAEGGKVRSAIADISDAVAVEEIMRSAAAWGSGLDIVVANAGISSGPGPALTKTGRLGNICAERWQEVLQVNLTGTMHTVSAGAGHLNDGTGRVIVISSVAGLRPDPLVGYAYSSTKAAITLFAQNAAVELAPRRISVNVLAPGSFLTPIGTRNPDNSRMLGALTEATAFKRLADPSEIEGVALFLSSPAAGHITGAVFTVDGGVMLGT